MTNLVRPDCIFLRGNRMPISAVDTTRKLKEPEIPSSGSHLVGLSCLFAPPRTAGGQPIPPSRSCGAPPGSFGHTAGNPSTMVFRVCFLLWALAFPFSAFSSAQSMADKPVAKETTDLKIQVRGGEATVPVKNASVYVEYRQGRFLVGKKKYKYGVKTNHEGVAAVREVPKGKILIQVVADGWKPFGKVYEIENDEVTVEILLQRPKKWY